MPAQPLPLGANAYQDNSYGFAPLVLENWFAEAAPDRVDVPYRLLPTPGLTSFKSGLGSSGIRGWFQADGLVGGDIVAAAGNNTYRIDSASTTTLLAVKSGSTAIASGYGARFAGSQVDLVMTIGGNAYYLDGTPEWVDITVGASTGDIVDVAEINQRHVFLENGTGRFWWGEAGDPTTVQATSFATAETEPDNLLALRTFGGLLYLFGTQSTEIWGNTGSDATPFRFLELSIPVGIVGREAVVQADFGIFAVGVDRASGSTLVYRVDQGRPQRVSTHPIERLIENVTSAERQNISLSVHGWGGHVFIGLHLPGVGDYFYDIAGGVWHRRRQTAETRYYCDTFIAAFGKVFGGRYDSGEIFRLDRDVYTEDSNAVRRVAQVLVPIQDGRPAIDSVEVNMQPGVGLVSGQGSDPQVMLRWSDNGRSWSNEVSRSFGGIGEYNTVAHFGPLGRFTPDVMGIEIAVSDPVPATVTGLVIGRARA